MIGSVLGKYRIEAELSRGGMGAVYKARHEVLGRDVALKLLRSDIASRDEVVTRFFNEAKAASAIRHPGIIEVIDFGHTDDGEAYLVMELLEGETVAARIAARRRLSARGAVHLARSIAAALAAAHGMGIVHRDLKPDNVFIVADPDVGERAKILDFGIAKLADQGGQTQTGTLMGTPLYMAPEQARSAGHIDHRADLYSLGCILYELVTGRPPFAGGGAGELIAHHMFTPVEPPTTHAADLPLALEAVIMRLLEKEPGDRFGSAAEVDAALASAIAGVAPSRPSAPDTSMKLAVVGPAPTVAPAAPRPMRSNLPLVAGGVLLAIAGIITLVVVVTRGSDTPARPAVMPVERAAPIVTAPVAPTPPVAETVPAPAPPTDVKITPRPKPAPRPPRPVGGTTVRTTDRGAPIETTVD